MVSIIIPCYNSIDYITDALFSAINQNADREIIVVDDCSTDGTIDLISRFIAENYIAENIKTAEKNLDGDENVRADGRFAGVKLLSKVQIKLPKDENKQADFIPCNLYIIKNRKNRGVAYSRNEGVRVARGKYVAFLDADDWWREDKLKKQLALIEKTGSFLCTTDRELVINNKPSGAVVKSPAHITFRRLRHSNWINCSAVLVRRNALARFPMEQGFIHEDYLCWLNIVREYGPAVNISEPLLLYRVRLKSKSGNKLRSLRLSFNTYRKFGYGFLKSMVCVIQNAFSGFLKFGKSFFKK
jgi:teichuronic acid biosynthesis glycosyltransferase TuaG